MKDPITIPDPTGSATNWWTANGPKVIAAGIIALVGIFLYKALPKWAFFLLAGIAFLIAVAAATKK